MISYCVAVYRPTYARLLLADLVGKTTTPFEILVWLNVADAGLDAEIAAAVARGVPLRVLGRTPENIGMSAYLPLFGAARYPLITQIDDDVVCTSRSIYHCSIQALLVALPFAPYVALGAAVRARLTQRHQFGLLDRGMQVFHVIGPAYAAAFGMLDFEIEKYRRLGRADIVSWYESHLGAPAAVELRPGRIDAVRAAVGRHGAWAPSADVVGSSTG